MNDLTTQKIEQSFFHQSLNTVLAWLGMAGVLVNIRGMILLIDPLLSMSLVNGQELCEGEHRLKLPLPIEAKDIPRIDEVLYTHADFDHFGDQTAKVFADHFQCRFIVPAPVARLLMGIGVAEDRIVQVNDNDVVQSNNAKILVTPALHDWQEQNPWRRGDCCGYLIHSPDGTIWHPGDTRLIPELMAIREVDVFFFDVAAIDAHLGPAGSAQLARSCGAKVMVPYHYGTFDLPPGSYGNCDPEDSLVYIENISAKFLKLNPGELLNLPLQNVAD